MYAIICVLRSCVFYAFSSEYSNQFMAYSLNIRHIKSNTGIFKHEDALAALVFYSEITLLLKRGIVSGNNLSDRARFLSKILIYARTANCL